MIEDLVVIRNHYRELLEERHRPRVVGIQIVDGQHIYRFRITRIDPSRFARLHDEDGQVLVFATIGLRPLLSRADAEVTVNLPGQSAARSMQLALDPGPPK